MQAHLRKKDFRRNKTYAKTLQESCQELKESKKITMVLLYNWRKGTQNYRRTSLVALTESLEHMNCLFYCCVEKRVRKPKDERNHPAAV